MSGEKVRLTTAMTQHRANASQSLSFIFNNICVSSKFSCHIFRLTSWSRPSKGVQDSDRFVSSVTHFTVRMKEIPIFWHETISCRYQNDLQK